MQRQFKHCLIACSFYRHLFKESAQEMEVGKKQLADFFPDSNFVSTVNTMEYLALEALNDIEGSVTAVQVSYDAGNVVNALRRFAGDFFLRGA